MTRVAGAQRSQPRPARLSRARGLRQRHVRRPVAACREAGAELGLDVDVRQTDDETELVGWLHEAADAGTPVVLNPAAFTHYSYALRDACAQLQRAAGRGAPDQPGGPRGVPAHLGRRRCRDRHDRRLRPRLLPTGACRPWPRCVPANRRTQPGRRARSPRMPWSPGPGATAPAPAIRGRPGRRGGPGHPAGQRPLPHRLHRLQRRPAGDRRHGRAGHRRPLHDPGRHAVPGRRAADRPRVRRALVDAGRPRTACAGWRSRPTTSPSTRTRTLSALDGAPGLRAARAAPSRRCATVKDDDEIALLREACAIGDRALAETARPGSRRAGPSATSPASSRPRCSSRRRRRRPSRPSSRPARTAPCPHHRPTDREIERGDLLKIDFGARYRGYHADCTRTFVVGASPRPGSRDLRRRTPRAARPAGRRCAPGRDVREVDAAARSSSSRPGTASSSPTAWATASGWRSTRRRCSAPPRPVDSPPHAGHRRAGVYLPGRGGVRIEDTLVVGDGAPELLTTTPKDLRGPLGTLHERRTSLVATTNDLKNGMVLNLDGQLWSVVEFQHVKPGKGGAFVRTKLKNVLSGKVVDKTFNAGTRSRRRPSTSGTCSTSTRRATTSCSWTRQSYDQIHVPAETVGDGAKYMLENQDAVVAIHEGAAALRRAARLGRAARSPTPSRACRATAPPAAPSRRRWRPAPRSRCRCSSPPARRSRWTPATAATSAA